jgi:hypothetical protein
MRMVRNLVAASIFAVAFIASPDGASADIEPAPSAVAPDIHALLEGTFVYSGPPQEEAARRAAIDRAIDSLFFAIRPIARWRLSEGTRIVPWVSFSFANGIVRTRGPEGLNLASPENGTPTNYTFRGERCRVTQVLRGGTLVQRYDADGGTGQNEWSLSPDGSVLRLKVTITSPRLPKAMVYFLTYKRRA